MKVDVTDYFCDRCKRRVGGQEDLKKSGTNFFDGEYCSYCKEWADKTEYEKIETLCQAIKHIAEKLEMDLPRGLQL